MTPAKRKKRKKRQKFAHNIFACKISRHHYYATRDYVT